MSRLDVTTQELFLSLDKTSQSRSAKADALFRRLRLEREDQIADALMRAPRALSFTHEETEAQTREAKTSKRAKSSAFPIIRIKS